MMELEDKKIVAKWMGYKSCMEENVTTGESYLVVNKNIGKGYRKWNPDTNHEQFKEVFNSLDIVQRTKVYKKLGCYDDDFSRSIQCDIISDLILNELPKVMRAVVQVIKESK